MCPYLIVEKREGQMPLLKGSSQKVVEKNVKAMVLEGYPRMQAVAIANKKARGGRKKGK